MFEYYEAIKKLEAEYIKAGIDLKDKAYQIALLNQVPVWMLRSDRYRIFQEKGTWYFKNIFNNQVTQLILQ